MCASSYPTKDGLREGAWANPYLLGRLVTCSCDFHKLPHCTLLGTGERSHFKDGVLGPEVQVSGKCWSWSEEVDEASVM